MDVRVIGLGNVLMADDGFGPYVVGALEARYEFSPEVTVLDVGTPGLDLTPYLMDADRLIVIDTVRYEAEPGTVRTWRKDGLLRRAPQPRLGPHDPGLEQTLRTLDFNGTGPEEVLLVGVVPARTVASPGLTDAVRAAVPLAIEEVLRELDRLGVSATARQDPHPVAAWWEETPEPAPAA